MENCDTKAGKTAKHTGKLRPRRKGNPNNLTGIEGKTDKNTLEGREDNETQVDLLDAGETFMQSRQSWEEHYKGKLGRQTITNEQKKHHRLHSK